MREIKLLRIVSIIKPAGFGATKPIIVRAEDENIYVLKTRDDGTNPKDLGIFNEMLAYHLHDYLEFNVSPQDICYLYIDDHFIDMAKSAYDERIIEKESFDFIKNSFGINIGIEYIENVMEIGLKLTKKFTKDLMRLDNYILNCDRVENSNANILQNKSDKRKIYAIDYGNSLVDGVLYDKIINDDLYAEAYSCNLNLSSQRYMFRKEKGLMNYKILNQNLEEVKGFLLDVINSMPENWEPIKYKDIIIDILANRLKNRNIFKIEDFEKCECMY